MKVCSPWNSLLIIVKKYFTDNYLGSQTHKFIKIVNCNLLYCLQVNFLIDYQNILNVLAEVKQKVVCVV